MALLWLPWLCPGYPEVPYVCVRASAPLDEKLRSQLTNAFQSLQTDLLKEFITSDMWRRMIGGLQLQPESDDSLPIIATLRATYAANPFLREGALPVHPTATTAPAVAVGKGGTGGARRHHLCLAQAVSCGLVQLTQTIKRARKDHQVSGQSAQARPSGRETEVLLG